MLEEKPNRTKLLITLMPDSWENNFLCFFSLKRSSLDNIDNIDERLYKDMQEFVFQRIRESPPIQKNITPMSGKIDENHQANLAHYIIQSSGTVNVIKLLLRSSLTLLQKVKSACPWQVCLLLAGKASSLPLQWGSNVGSCLTPK